MKKGEKKEKRQACAIGSQANDSKFLPAGKQKKGGKGLGGKDRKETYLQRGKNG